MGRVLFWTVAMTLFVSPAFGASGTITNSAHDLSSSSTYTRQNGGEQQFETGFTQLCAYCHTPHKADLTVVNAPLWNRTVAVITAYTYYNSSTLTTAARPSGHGTNDDDSDLGLCMSCHDGTSITDPLTNPVSGDDNSFTTIDNIGAGSTGLLLDATNSLKNDHPIGFDYESAQGEDSTGLVLLATAKTKGVKFFGSSANMMWCSSCHAVHNPGSSGADAPFLRTTAAGSYLCLACHSK